MWEKVDPTAVAHIDAFRGDPVSFWHFYGERFATLEGKRPNGAHEVLAQMERAGALDAVITQNVDMLHRRAGTRELVEVHGSIAGCSCLSCGERVELAQARARMSEDPEGVPRCSSCAAPLKPDVVLFGELLPERAIAPRGSTPSPRCACTAMWSASCVRWPPSSACAEAAGARGLFRPASWRR